MWDEFSFLSTFCRYFATKMNRSANVGIAAAKCECEDIRVESSREHRREPLRLLSVNVNGVFCCYSLHISALCSD